METIGHDREANPILGIIIPCHNEEDVLSFSAGELLKTLNDLENRNFISGKSFISLIDDGSTDGTWGTILELYGRLPEKVKGLKLSRNFGHQNALLAGMLTFNFDICVTMDADLQDSPDIVVDMLEKYRCGYEIVYGVRSRRESDTLFKRSTARMFYVLMNTLGVKIVRDHADFRLLTRKVVETLRDFTEVNIFLRGIIPYLGFNSAVTYYERRSRKAGKTKYPVMKMLSFALEGITSFSIVPLRLVSFLGFIIFFFAFLLSCYFLIAMYLGKTIPGWTSIILSLYILSGLIIFSLGIIGEYVGKIYTEVKQRPRFIVETKLE